jgi:CheY-like chemotaxis protein
MEDIQIARPAGEEVRVLIVDDEAVIRLRLKELCQKLGYRPYTAADGAEGWASFLKNEPDLAIVDIYMPVMNGLFLMRKIRLKSPKIPVILISAYLKEGELAGFSNTQPDVFIPKPFKMEEMTAAIGKVLEYRQEEICEPA